jgi:hypothetical protein
MKYLVAYNQSILKQSVLNACPSRRGNFTGEQLSACCCNLGSFLHPLTPALLPGITTPTKALHGVHALREDEPQPKFPDADGFVGEVKGHVLTNTLHKEMDTIPAGLEKLTPTPGI